METGELLSIFSWADTFDATALFGKSCSPFFFAFGGGKCEAKPVCCTHSSVVRLAVLTISVSFHLFILTGWRLHRRMLEC